VAAYLVEQELAAISPGDRTAAAVDLVRALEQIHRHYGTPPPAWLGVMRNGFRASEAG
jgi:hypothetical protein